MRSDFVFVAFIVLVCVVFVVLRFSAPYGGMGFNEDPAPKQVTVVTR